MFPEKTWEHVVFTKENDGFSQKKRKTWGILLAKHDEFEQQNRGTQQIFTSNNLDTCGRLSAKLEFEDPERLGCYQQ